MQFKSSEPEMAWKSFEIERGAAESPILVLCDHASNFLPPKYGTLGLDEQQLNRHIGYDIGALPVALEIGRRLQATMISTCFSRLLIDANRGEDDPTLIMQLSDGAIVPGNACIGEGERAERIASFFAPYHGAIDAEIDMMLASGVTPAIVSVHSFTEAWRGVPRKWHASILWDKDPRLAVPLLQQLRARTGSEIGENEPYLGYLRNDGIYRHATVRGLPNALIEVRQDLIRSPEGQHRWGSLISECLRAILDDPVAGPALKRVDYFGSHADMVVNDRNIRDKKP